MGHANILADSRLRGLAHGAWSWSFGLGVSGFGGLELWDLGFGVWFWRLVISDSESPISKLDLRSAMPWNRHPGATPKAKPESGKDLRLLLL